ncbi:MAG: hypothetical protein ABEJ80_02655 [Halarchaeum sp.]
MATLFWHHTHTPDSNATERAVRGVPSGNHRGDYLAVLDAAPPGVDVVFTRTEHWRAPPERFETLRERVRARGGTYREYRAHAVVEVAGSRGAVLNGVEASLATDRSHVTVCGLPIEERPPARACSLDELVELAGEAAWLAPAHPRFPTLGFPPERLRGLLSRAESAGIPAALGHTTGYTRALNALARGRHTATPVRAFADEFDVPLLPELDWHAALPRSPAGFGVVDDAAFDALAAGEMPTERLLDARAIREAGPPGLSWRDFLRTYPDSVPRPLRRVAAAAPPSAASLDGVRDASLARLFAHSFWASFADG